jgi:hypothetical protein
VLVVPLLLSAVLLLTSCPESVCTSSRPDHSFSPLLSLQAVAQLVAVSTGLAPLRGSHADDTDAAAAGATTATAAASPAVAVVVLLAVSVSTASSTVLLRSLYVTVMQCAVVWSCCQHMRALHA